MKRIIAILALTIFSITACGGDEVRNPDLAKVIDPSCNMVKTADGKLVYTEKDARAHFGGAWDTASLDQATCVITISRFKKSTDPKGPSTVGEAIVITPGDQEIFDRNQKDASATQIAGISEMAVRRADMLYIKKGSSYLSVKCAGEGICTDANYAKAGKLIADRLK